MITSSSSGLLYSYLYMLLVCRRAYNTYCYGSEVIKLCVYMNVCMHLCVFVHVCVCVYKYIYACMPHGCVCVHAYACTWMCQHIRETDRVMSVALIPSQPSSSNGILKHFINVTNTSVPCDTTNDTMYNEETFTSNNTTDTCAVPLNAKEIYYIFLVSFLVHVQCDGPVMSLAVSQSKLCILSICLFQWIID